MSCDVQLLKAQARCSSRGSRSSDVVHALTGWAFLNVADYLLSWQVDQNIRADIIQSHIIPIKRYHTQVRDYRAAAWALPERAAGVCVGLDGCAQQVALWLADVVSAVLGGIMKHQLCIKADVLAALIHTQRIWRRAGSCGQQKWRKNCSYSCCLRRRRWRRNNDLRSCWHRCCCS